MSKTTKKFAGKTYKPRKHDNKSKSKAEKKFLAFTSGQHSRGITDVEIKDGKITYTKSDRAPVKGKDFVKYGYPFETRHPKVLKNLAKERESKKQLKNLKSGKDE
jgi:hypothetical protein